jgi:hypothetical protein
MEKSVNEVVKEVKQVTDKSVFYAVKTTDIIYVTIIFFVFGYYIAKVSDNISDNLFGTEYKKLSRNELIVEIIFQMSLSILLSYFCKKVIDRIPFPLEGLGGFTHYKLKEFTMSGGTFWMIGIFFYQRSLVKKINLLKKMF